jgi:hypothetical protein
MTDIRKPSTETDSREDCRKAVEIVEGVLVQQLEQNFEQFFALQLEMERLAGRFLKVRLAKQAELLADLERVVTELRGAGA